jgi:hypothetical protein
MSISGGNPEELVASAEEEDEDGDEDEEGEGDDEPKGGGVIPFVDWKRTETAACCAKKLVETVVLSLFRTRARKDMVVVVKKIAITGPLQCITKALLIASSDRLSHLSVLPRPSFSPLSFRPSK